MRKPLQIHELQEILDFGGGISVDAADYELHQILYLVSHATQRNAAIIVRNARRLERHQLRDIASRAKGTIVFEV